MRKHNGMRPQDVLVLLKILKFNDEPWLGNRVAHELSISPSEVSEVMNRCEFARLIDERRLSVNRRTLFEFLMHGLPYVFPVRPGAYARGIPTAHSGPPLNEYLVHGSNQAEQYVWPDAEGSHWGLTVEPLYPTVVNAIRHDKELYALLSLTDALRIGRPREKSIAVDLLAELMKVKR
ncbi:hypothetical protein [Hymenobacter guriensis]|uniref:hypothetical protein n=1 Tax=Hymenobacter guriensis TaxID=2793065 RepID=UPI001E63C6B1|nr:hypothetical protein [Hymenobacter guriensis]